MNGVTASSSIPYDPADLRRVAEQVRARQQQSLERLAAKVASRHPAAASPATAPAAGQSPAASPGPLGRTLDVRG